MEDFLVIEDVGMRFGEFAAVRDFSLSVREGEIFALLGPSGCGKTTLLRLLAGFLRPDEGRILIDGVEVTGLPPERRPVNTVFQSYALFPHLSVRDNIAFGLRMARRPRAEIAAGVDRMLALMDLAGEADRRPEAISGGQRQRVALARALVNRPRVLLLDEPLAALDLKLRQRLLVELEAVHKEVGTTFLYVTHDQTEAMAVSHRIGVMRRGGLEQVAPPEEIYERPVNGFVAAFIGETNFLRGRMLEARAGLRRAHAEGLGEIWIEGGAEGGGEREFTLSLRPERLRLEPAAAGGEAPGAPRTPGGNLFEGVVEDVIYLGATTRYRVRAGELLLLAETGGEREGPGRRPARGGRVAVSWEAGDGCLLCDGGADAGEGGGGGP